MLISRLEDVLNDVSLQEDVIVKCTLESLKAITNQKHFSSIKFLFNSVPTMIDSLRLGNLVSYRKHIHAMHEDQDVQITQRLPRRISLIVEIYNKNNTKL